MLILRRVEVDPVFHFGQDPQLIAGGSSDNGAKVDETHLD
jgi:hypothetical protein